MRRLASRCFPFESSVRKNGGRSGKFVLRRGRAMNTEDRLLRRTGVAGVALFVLTALSTRVVYGPVLFSKWPWIRFSVTMSLLTCLWAYYLWFFPVAKKGYLAFFYDGLLRKQTDAELHDSVFSVDMLWLPTSASWTENAWIILGLGLKMAYTLRHADSHLRVFLSRKRGEILSGRTAGGGGRRDRGILIVDEERRCPSSATREPFRWARLGSWTLVL